MRKYLFVVVLVGVVACGCNWEGIESGAAGVAKYAEEGAALTPALTPIAGPYAPMAGLVLSGVANIALALKALAAHKKKKDVAKAAVIAAESNPGGGANLNTAAALMNAGPEIRAAYEKAKKDGTL